MLSKERSVKRKRKLRKGLALSSGLNMLGPWKVTLVIGVAVLMEGRSVSVGLVFEVCAQAPPSVEESHLLAAYKGQSPGAAFGL